MKMRRAVMLLAMFVVFLILFPITPNPVQGQQEDINIIVLTDSTNKIILDSAIEILKDKKHAYTFEDLTLGLHEDDFIRYQGKGRPNLGYSNGAVWVRFQIQNQSNQSDWFFEIESAKINEVILYEKSSNNSWIPREGGNLLPFKDRDVFHRNIGFNLQLTSDEIQTIYLRIHTDSSIQTAFTIWDHAAHSEKSLTEYAVFGMIFGISLVMALYNLFLFFSVGDRSYLFYVLFVAINSLLYLSDTGLAYQFLWPGQIEWNDSAITMFMFLGNISGLLFTRSFLETKQFLPKLDILIKILIYTNLFFASIRIFTSYGAVYAAIILVLLMITLILTTAIISLKKGNRSARFFLLAWSIFLCGVFISLMVDPGIIPNTVMTKYAWQLTTSLEVVLLSFALGDKYKTIKEEKEKAVKEANKSQKIALESLRRADELKDEFLAITSHELRTPLNGIIGIAETLHDGAAGEVSDKVRAHLTMIITSGRRLSNLINDILDFSKLKNNDLDIQLVPVHLAELTNVVITVCHSLIKDRPIQLINKIDPSVPMVIGDENRLQQIIYNLIGNAIKYTKQGTVSISAEQAGEYLKITVKDTGEGIPSYQLETIFEPFHQGNIGSARESGGTGIGLSITKKLVGLHQGEIFVKSKVGRGSEFSFTLPISQDQTQSVRETASLTVQPFKKETEQIEMVTAEVSISNQNAIKILVADDEPVNQQVLMNQLALEGYEVIVVSNGEDAISTIRNGSIDLLILDIMMPKISGYEVCRILRKEYSLMELPILMLTAKNQVNDKITSFEVGANDYLAKPCDKQELLSRVKTLIQLKELNKELIQINLHLENKVQGRTEELQTANRYLEKMNEDLMTMAESRQHLLANIAHELGTPVTVIHGYMQALRNGLIETNETYFLEMVASKVKLLERLIDDLFDLSKLEAGQIHLDFKEVQLEDWLTQLFDILYLDILQGGRTFIREFDVENDNAQYFVTIDTDRMDQVFSNLICNAIKHTSSVAGEIAIRAKVIEENQEVLLQVSDNGFGINPEILPFIFERFYKATLSSTESEVGGTGLGLSIVKEIVNGHNGTIWVDSEINVGSTFTISLPLRIKMIAR